MRNLVLMLAIVCSFLSGVAEETTLTRNEVLMKLYAAMHEPGSARIESAKLTFNGKMTYLFKGSRGKFLFDGKPMVVYDGKLAWTRGKERAGDPLWLPALIYGVRPLPEVFSDVKLFPVLKEVDGRRFYQLLCRRDEWRVTVVIDIDADTFLIDGMRVTSPEGEQNYRFLDYRWTGPCRIAYRVDADDATGKEMEIQAEWNVEINETEFTLPQN